MISGTITADVKKCARCGDSHLQLMFFPFTQAPDGDEYGSWSHWTLCPKLREPILFDAPDEE